MLSWRNKKNIYLIPSSYLEIGQRLSPASKSIAPDKQSWDFLYFSMKTDAVGIHKKHFNELRCFQWVPTTCFFLWRNNFMTKVMAPPDKVFFFCFFFVFCCLFFFFSTKKYWLTGFHISSQKHFCGYSSALLLCWGDSTECSQYIS